MTRAFGIAVPAAILLAATLAGADVTPALEPPAPSVSFDDGLVSVEADGVPLDELLAAIGEASGVAIRGEVLDPRPVTVWLDGVPLREAVDRLLRRQNFTMRYRADGTLRWITLRGATLEPRPARAERVQSFSTLVARGSIDVPPSLQPRFGAARVRLSRFLRTAGRLPEPALRRVCLHLFLNAVQRDAAMRGALRAMNVHRLDQFAQRYFGGRSRELVEFLSTQSADPGVRLRAKMAARWTGAATGG